MSGLRITATRSLDLQRLLMARAYTITKLAKASGLSVAATRNWMTKMRGQEPKVVHIEDYAEDSRGRMVTPMWRWGGKPDKPRVGQRRTSTDRMRDLAARRKAAKC